MSFSKKYKYHIALFVALLIATTVSGILAFKKPIVVETKQASPLENSTHSDQNNRPINDNPPYQGGQARLAEDESSESRRRGSLANPSTESLQTPPAPHGRGEDAPVKPVYIPPAVETVPAQQIDNKTISASLSVEGKNYSLKIPEKSTAYNVMTEAQQQGHLTLHATSYGDLGYMIDEINGIKNSAKNHKFWIYYINNKKATIGVSNYFIHEGDVIEWKYEDEE